MSTAVALVESILSVPHRSIMPIELQQTTTWQAAKIHIPKEVRRTTRRINEQMSDQYREP